MKKVSECKGTSLPWLFRSTVLCSQYYFYVVDEDLGPLFIKCSSYAPVFSQLTDGCPKAPYRPIANTMRQLDRSMQQLIDDSLTI